MDEGRGCFGYPHGARICIKQFYDARHTPRRTCSPAGHPRPRRPHGLFVVHVVMIDSFISFLKGHFLGLGWKKKRKRCRSMR